MSDKPICPCPSCHSPAAKEAEEDWRDDPSADERWNAGLDYGMKAFCEALGVDPQSVRWDAATETLDGDVNAVIWNILRAKMGDDWDPDAARSSQPETVSERDIEIALLGWPSPAKAAAALLSKFEVRRK